MEVAFPWYSTSLQRLQATMKGALLALQLHNPLDFQLTARLSVSASNEGLLCSRKTTKGNSPCSTDIEGQFYSLLASWTITIGPERRLEKVHRRKSLLKHNKEYITRVIRKLGSIHLASDKFSGQRRKGCSFRGQESYFLTKYRMMKHVWRGLQCL